MLCKNVLFFLSFLRIILPNIYLLSRIFFQSLHVILLPSGLHALWWEMFFNFIEDPLHISHFSLAVFNFLFLVFWKFNYDACRYVFLLFYLGIYWSFWISILMSFIILGKCSAIMSLLFFYFLSLSSPSTTLFPYIVGGAPQVSKYLFTLFILLLCAP